MIYLAQPHSHADQRIMDIRAQHGAAVAAEYFRNGFHCYAPIPFWHQIALAEKLHISVPDFDQWRAIDFEYLSFCNQLDILTLAGWTKSKGVRAEVEQAIKQNIRIAYVTIIGWKWDPKLQLNRPVLQFSSVQSLYVDEIMKGPAHGTHSQQPGPDAGSAQDPLGR